MKATPLEKAIKAAGGESALARAIGVTRQAVHGWAKVPADRALAVERATDGRVRCYELRPDVFPKPAEAA